MGAIVSKLFNTAVKDFDTKQSARYSLVIVLAELVVSGTQCIEFMCTVQNHISTDKTRVNVPLIGIILMVFVLWRTM